MHLVQKKHLTEHLSFSSRCLYFNDTCIMSRQPDCKISTEVTVCSPQIKDGRISQLNSNKGTFFMDFFGQQRKELTV